MASKLTDITPSYRSFEDDQVLTANQLNEFIDYFEDQDRLSRVCLTGVGIVCGFGVDNTTPSKIIIKQGAGITSDGDLINLSKPGSKEPLKKINVSEITYTNYRIFEDTNAFYDRFRDPVTNVQFPIWEVIESTDVTDPAVEPALPGTLNLQSMVALLYLESYEDDSDLCEGLNCDNQGILQVQRLRVLLVNQSDVNTIISMDSVFNKHDLMSVYMQMKDLSVKRVIMDSLNTSTITDLVKSYQLDKEAQLLSSLKDGLYLMKEKITPYNPTNPLASIINNLAIKLPAAQPSDNLFFQYRHDLLKDVVDSYNEIKDLFIKLNTECCPDIQAFPKHLMLGKLRPTEEEVLAGKYTHGFYKSPVLVDTDVYKEFSTALKRLDEQLKAYTQLPETVPKPGLFRSEIRITPSKFRAPLRMKAIPFYYTVGLPLLRSWDFAKSIVGKYRRNLGYDTTLLDADPIIQTPLRYNLEPSNFYRIEGQQAQDYKTAMAKIDEIKRANGLSFDLKAIGIDVDTSLVIGTEDYECEFGELSVLLNAWVKEQECNLASVTSLISAYSLTQPGKNIKDKLYLPKQAIFTQAQVGIGTPGREGINIETGLSASDLNTVEEAGLSHGPQLMAQLTSGSTNLGDISMSLEAERQEVMTQNVNGTTGNVVIDNLTLDQSTLGAAVFKAIQGNLNSSPFELIANANDYAFEVAQGTNWDQAAYVSIVDNSIEILSYAHVLANSIPLSIAGITDQVIANYNTNINRLCMVLKRVQVTHASTTNLSEQNKAIMGTLINQLSGICCASKQLQTLLAEIDKRKDGILEKLTLKRFIEEHPGAEHLGGVEPGGTFILVYLKKPIVTSNGVTQTASGTVIADFSLPYMCCSDCSPINFIMPKAPVQLRLPKTLICLGTDTVSMNFQVEPVGGIIKADRVIPGMTINGTLLTINPGTFPNSELNKLITFTVNDQITACQLTVSKPLAADFNVPASPVSNPVINFTPIGNFVPGTQFLWEFGDGNTSTQKNTTHTYQLPVDGDNSVTVQLTVTPANGACPTYVTKDITFQEVSIQLPGGPFCANDTNAYDFVITPSGAQANIAGPGVVDNQFIPADAFEGDVPIYLNGTEVMEITVMPIAHITITPTRDSENLYLSAALTNAETFNWILISNDGQELYTDSENLNLTIPWSYFDERGLEPGESFTVVLFAGEGCAFNSQSKIVYMPVNTTNCAIDADQTATDNYQQVLSLYDEQAAAGVLSPDQFAFFSNGYTFVRDIDNTFPSYISGANNEMVVGRTGDLIINLLSLINSANVEQRPYLMAMYRLVLQGFLSVYQCQDNAAYTTTEISALFEQIYSHFDSTNEESFPIQGLNIDPDGTLRAAVEHTLSFRSAGTISYSRINQLLQYLLPVT